MAGAGRCPSWAWRGELLGHAFEDLLNEPLYVPPLPNRPHAEPLEHGSQQRKAQGDHREFRLSRRSRVTVGVTVLGAARAWRGEEGVMAVPHISRQGE